MANRVTCQHRSSSSCYILVSSDDPLLSYPLSLVSACPVWSASPLYRYKMDTYVHAEQVRRVRRVHTAELEILNFNFTLTLPILLVLNVSVDMVHHNHIRSEIKVINLIFIPIQHIVRAHTHTFWTVEHP